MFPVEFCQSRKSAGLPILSPDDMAWISKLYPRSSYASSYGTLSGFVLFSDGITAFQGVNVIARRMDDPSTPKKSRNASRCQVRVEDSSLRKFLDRCRLETTREEARSEAETQGLIGYYEIPVTPGTYTVEVETIDSVTLRAVRASARWIRRCRLLRPSPGTTTNQFATTRRRPIPSR